MSSQPHTGVDTCLRVCVCVVGGVGGGGGGGDVLRLGLGHCVCLYLSFA